MQLRFAEMGWFGQDAGGLRCDGEGRNRLSNALMALVLPLVVSSSQKALLGHVLLATSDFEPA